MAAVEPVYIRPASLEDAARIAEIHVRAWQRTAASCPTPFWTTEVRARVPAIYDSDALEVFLSWFPEETRAMLLDEFFTSPGADMKSIPQFGGPGMQARALADALRAVFAPLHRHSPDLATQFPFDDPGTNEK